MVWCNALRLLHPTRLRQPACIGMVEWCNALRLLHPTRLLSVRTAHPTALMRISPPQLRHALAVFAVFQQHRQGAGVGVCFGQRVC